MVTPRSELSTVCFPAPANQRDKPRGDVVVRICVVTSYAADAEPRAPRHAVAAREAFPDAEVVLVDFAAAGEGRSADPAGLSAHGIRLVTLEFPTRQSNPFGLALRKAKTRLARASFKAFGIVHEWVFGERTQGLTKALRALQADVYVAHNIETLLPAIDAANSHKAAVVFDCMEYYSDMGDGQDRVHAAAARQLEALALPCCKLVIASSDVMADALAAEYAITRPLPAYNVPPIAEDLPSRLAGGVNLYWRNSVIGFGQRGLEDALTALTLLPADVRLFLQGRPSADGGRLLAERVGQLGLQDRVIVLPPYRPQDAIRQAAPYDIGLCLERKGPRNHDLTVSNKMFDYHMAGLAVISADLEGLADVLRRSGAGFTFEAGDPASLAAAVRRLHASPATLAKMQRDARLFAIGEANMAQEVKKIAMEMRSALGRVAAPRSSSNG